MIKHDDVVGVADVGEPVGDVHGDPPSIAAGRVAAGGQLPEGFEDGVLGAAMSSSLPEHTDDIRGAASQQKRGASFGSRR